MTPITDTRDPLPMNLHIRQQFATHAHESVGEVMALLEDKMARQLAHKILNERKFFELSVDKGYGTMRADVIVMTMEEYREKMQSQFRKGIDHAHGFMPAWRDE